MHLLVAQRCNLVEKYAYGHKLRDCATYKYAVFVQKKKLLLYLFLSVIFSPLGSAILNRIAICICYLILALQPILLLPFLLPRLLF